MSATLGGGLAEGVRDLMGSCREGGDEGAAAGGSSGSGNGVEAAVGGGEGGGGGEQEGQVPVVVSEGRSYPVQTVYLGAPGER